MVEDLIRNTSKRTWYKWSIYINAILFFVVIIVVYFLIQDSITAGRLGGSKYLNIVRDVAALAVVLAFIFYQFFRNLFVIMRRSL